MKQGILIATGAGGASPSPTGRLDPCVLWSGAGGDKLLPYGAIRWYCDKACGVVMRGLFTLCISVDGRQTKTYNGMVNLVPDLPVGSFGMIDRRQFV